MTKKIRIYSTEFKAEAVKKVAHNNGNISVTAKQLELNKYADSKCVRDYKKAAKKILLKSNKNYDDFLRKYIL